MNWYKKAQFKKIAGVSFWIEGTDKIAQPMNKFDICNDLQKFISYEMGIGEQLGIGFNDVDPDSSSGDVFSFTGPISIYLKNPSIKNNIINSIVDHYNTYREGSIKLKFLGINTSGVRGINTARLLIEENNTQNLDDLPGMHLSNDNASALISLLSNEGMQSLDTYGGSLNTAELKIVINNIEQNDFVLKTYTREPSDSQEPGIATQEPGQARIIDHGRSYERLTRYIENLKVMINYIETNNLPNQTINYG